MSIQSIIVLLCVLVAVLFMCRKIYRTLTRKSLCDCDSAATCRNRVCQGGGECPESRQYRELTLRKR